MERYGSWAADVSMRLVAQRRICGAPCSIRGRASARPHRAAPAAVGTCAAWLGSHADGGGKLVNASARQCNRRAGLQIRQGVTGAQCRPGTPGVDTIGQTATDTRQSRENQFLIAMFEALVPSGASQPRGKTMAKKAKKKSVTKRVVGAAESAVKKAKKAVTKLMPKKKAKKKSKR